MSEGPLWDVIDCFSGGGLFSLGAQAAGMQIRECVDNSPDALSVYKLNFPVNVSCATLGPGLSEYAFPKPRPQLHVHLSPPCTELSNAKSGKRLEAEGIAMLRWSVEIGAQYHSFSVETVYTAHTLALAKEMVVEQPEVIKFGVYDAINFSAPQSRVRLIISTPQIIKRLNEAPASARVSVEDAFNAERMELPPGATHLKNSSPVVDGSNVRPIQGPAFTCCASRALSFCDSAGRTVVSMKPSHTRVLMGLPSFKLSGKQRIDQRVLGNGIVFGLSRAIALAAMGRPIEPSSAPHTSLSEPTGGACACRQLAKRVLRVERCLAKLKKKQRSS